MAHHDITDLLYRFGEAHPEAAWEAFLEQYSSILQQVIALSAEDPDSLGDCFVFVCEQLAEKRFRRLRKFDPSGAASFATWLRAVVRNLCIDWRRKNHGRFQPFGWTKQLDELDRQVFHSVYERGGTVSHAFESLAPVVPALTVAMVEESAERIGAKLTSRERWLLSSRQVHVESLDAAGEEGRKPLDIADLSPHPERAAIDGEFQEALAAALKTLPPADQLLVRMRFEQGLTLAEIARIARLKDAQSVDRRIRGILDQLRGQLSRFMLGKPKAASV